ncbi:hypothetical protein R6Q59_027105 [Mikania micrantha]
MVRSPQVDGDGDDKEFNDLENEFNLANHSRQIVLKRIMLVKNIYVFASISSIVEDTPKRNKN